MDCFHCPHAAAIARGDYADCAWQDTPCFGCECGSGADSQPYREAVRVDERLVADGRPARPTRRRPLTRFRAGIRFRCWLRR
jgi:hypothetical protein